MIRQPKIEKNHTDWITLYPSGVDAYFDKYWEAIELMNINHKKAEKIFKDIIIACGNGHLDAILHLGFLLSDTGKPIEGNALITKAHAIATDAFPITFKIGKDQLHWNSMENRPILRAFHAYGLELMKDQNYEGAIKEFEFILKINPGDNQGVRYLIIECLFILDRLGDILKLEKRYPDDYSVEFLYGKALALYMLDRKDEAARQLRKAKDTFPFVAEELVKTKHVFPADEFDQQYGLDGYGYPLGSRQQAYEYWETTKQFWSKAENIKEFIVTDVPFN